MKSIGIILVMLGHYDNIPFWFLSIASSFYMPMFFILSGVFIKEEQVFDKTSYFQYVKKQFTRLIVPVIITMGLLIVYSAIQAFLKDDVSYLYKQVLTLVWGGSNMIHSRYGLIYMGPMWFLIALFWGKIVAIVLINKLKKKALLIGLILYGAVLILRKWIPSCPWCVLQGIYAVPYIMLGWYFSSHKPTRSVQIIVFSVWVGVLCFSLWNGLYLGVSSCGYVIPYVDIISAGGGTLVVYYIAKGLSNVSHKMLIPLLWIGANTMAILCMHNFVNFSSIDCSILLHSPLSCLYNTSFWGVFRFGLTMFLAWMMTMLPGLRKVYR